MEALMTAATQVFTAAIGMVGEVGATIAEQPILLLSCVGIPLCGIGIGMFKRLLSTRA